MISKSVFAAPRLQSGEEDQSECRREMGHGLERSWRMMHFKNTNNQNPYLIYILTSIPASVDDNASSIASASATDIDPAAANRSVAASQESAREYSSVSGSGE